METFDHSEWALGSGIDHVVDWQIAKTSDGAYQTGNRDIPEIRARLRALEARALTLSHAVVRDPAAVVARRSLVALDAEIAAMRAELAWHRAEVRERLARPGR